MTISEQEAFKESRKNMKNNDYKKQAFLDRFIKRWCCSADNHPKGWAWWKKKARRDVRRNSKEELRKRINEDAE